jgi:hypothetical protein
LFHAILGVDLMYLLTKHRHLTIYCLVATTLIALSGGQTTVAANQQASSVVTSDRSQSNLIADNFDISQERPNSLFKGLPNSVVKAVREDITRRTGIPSGRVRILRYSRQAWPDACLGLRRNDEYCAEVVTPGWRVFATGDRQTWVYRSDEQGRKLRLEDKSAIELPESVKDAVFRDIEERFKINPNGLRVTDADSRSWSDGCLGLPRQGQVCKQTTVPGWRVTVVKNNSQWVYRTNTNGTIVKFDERSSNNVPDSDVELPKRIVDRVLEDAASILRVETYQLKITDAREKTWPGGCLGLPRSGEACTRNLVPGWEVTVRYNREKLVYRTNRSGSTVRLDRKASDFDRNTTSELPDYLADKVLRETQRRSGLSLSRLKIAEVQRRTWSDSCLGLGGIAETCATGRFPGWRVTVEGRDGRWVYHTDESDSRIIFNAKASDSNDNGAIAPDRIPSSELPSPLGENVVFRAISSGGFAGRTDEIVLLEDGRIQRFANNSSFPEIFNRISASEVREFQKLLDEERFYQFDRLDYKPNRGAADFITVTLTSVSGTTRYADIIQDRLPSRLEKVISAWNDIGNK